MGDLTLGRNCCKADIEETGSNIKRICNCHGLYYQFIVSPDMYILLFPLSDLDYNVDVHTTRKLLFLQVLQSRNKSQTLHVSIHNEILAFSMAAWALTKKKKQSVIC